MKGVIFTDNGKNSYGELIVRVTSGLGVLPVENARIYVKEYGPAQNGSRLIYTLTTDESGASPAVILPTPSREESLTPNSTTLPYAEYVTTVVKEGYRTVENIGIPLFEGIRSVQTVDLVPLTEEEDLNGGSELTTYYENNGYLDLRGNVYTDRNGGEQ